MSREWIALAASTLLIGCATVPMASKEADAAAKSFAPSPDKANLFVYRASSFGGGVKFPVMLDGRMLGELPGSTFILTPVSPGPHEVIVSGESSKTVSFNADAGKNVYIKVTPVMGWASAGVNLTLMTDEKEAKEDVAGCSLIEGMGTKLPAQAAAPEKKLTETCAAAADLDLQSGEFAKVSKELDGSRTIRFKDPVRFPEKASKLSPENKRALDSIADAIAQAKGRSILIAGFTDNAEVKGKDAAVQRWQLSTTRALEVAKYLLGRGMDPTLVGLAGFGDGKPVVPNDSIANRSLNRRVEITLGPTRPGTGAAAGKPAAPK